MGIFCFLGASGISNAFHGTKVFFNSNIPEILDYTVSMATPAEPLTQTVTQIVAPPVLTLEEDLLQTPRKTIADLLGATEVRSHTLVHLYILTSIYHFLTYFFIIFFFMHRLVLVL